MPEAVSFTWKVAVPESSVVAVPTVAPWERRVTVWLPYVGAVVIGEVGGEGDGLEDVDGGGRSGEGEGGGSVDVDGDGVAVVGDATEGGEGDVLVGAGGSSFTWKVAVPESSVVVVPTVAPWERRVICWPMLEPSLLAKWAVRVTVGRC